MFTPLLFFSCASTEEVFEPKIELFKNIEITQSEAIPSVLNITFESFRSGKSYVRFGYDGLLQYTTPIQDSALEHHALLVGVPPRSAIEFQIVLEVNAQVYESELITAQNGALDYPSKAFTVTYDQYSYPNSTKLLMSVFGEPCNILMTRMDGTVLWHKVQGSTENAGLGVRFDNGTILYNTLPIGTENASNTDNAIQ